MADNAVVEIADWNWMQELAANFSVAHWEQKFQAVAARFASMVEKFTHGYDGSAMQVEQALEVVFAKREALRPL